MYNWILDAAYAGQTLLGLTFSPAKPSGTLGRVRLPCGSVLTVAKRSNRTQSYVSTYFLGEANVWLNNRYFQQLL